HSVARTGAGGSVEQQAVRGLYVDAARVWARRRLDDFGAGNVDGIRIGIFADVGVFACTVRGGAGWELFSGLCEGTSGSQVSLCFAARPDWGCGAVLFPAAGGLDRLADCDSHRAAISYADHRSHCASGAATRHAETLPDVALSGAGAGGRGKFSLYFDFAQRFSPRGSVRGGDSGGWGCDLYRAVVAAPGVAIWGWVVGRWSLVVVGRRSLFAVRGKSKHSHGGNDQNAGSGADPEEAFGFGLGSAWGAVVSFALDCIGHLLHGHVDAERGRRLADDAVDHESADGWIGAGGRGSAGVSGHPAGGRAGRHGGSSAIFVANAGMDGVGFGDARHPDANQLRRTVGAAAVYVSARPRCGDERSGMAGDYSGVGSSGATCFGSGSELRWV